VQPAQELVAAEMETVLYAQMLALFAPQAVRGAAHVSPLLATLASRQPALRRAAADTLRHLAERCALLLAALPALQSQTLEPSSLDSHLGVPLREAIS